MPTSLLTVTPLTASGISHIFDNIPSTGLVLWLDATKIAGITSGTSLSAWTDSSASASHATQPSIVSGPVYLTNQQNGKAAVSFTSTIKQFFVTSNASLSQPYTAFATGSVTAASPTQELWAVSPAGNPSAAVFGGVFVAACNTVLSSSTFTTGWIIHSFIANGSASTLVITTSIGSSLVTGDAGTNAIAAVTGIGAASNGAAPLTGKLGEILLYARALPNSERQQVEDYLRAKWGL